MRVDFKILGMVSPYPKNEKSCPGYLLKFNNHKVLMDCGSGICNKFKFPEDFYNLSIFITHFHKDHYSDLFSFAYASYVYNKLGILKNKIDVYIPKVEENDSSYLDYLLVKNMREHYFNIIEVDENSVINIENLNISFFKTHHPIVTYAIKIEKKDFKFIYGSDMGYENINNFINFSKEADYLLLESSFIKKEEKKENYHLSAEEAAILAKYANAKKLILTHFWPEFDNNIYLLEAKKYFDDVIIAIDDQIMIL